ncbi:hypothetical protein DL765_001564 [Monosporascus sp. GIB2]|nr:hypothetical protein DL765_001564 [Monosporascus sp. GIB2]
MPSPNKSPLPRGTLASLLTILDPTSSPSEAEALLLALMFRFLALDALVSFALITTLAVASADPETFPFAPIRGCSIAHTVVSTLCFAVGATLWARIYYFKHNPTPPPRMGYVPPREDVVTGGGGPGMSFDTGGLKAEARASGLRGVAELGEFGPLNSRAANPYEGVRGQQQSSTLPRNFHQSKDEPVLGYSQYGGWPPSEMLSGIPRPPPRLAGRRSQSSCLSESSTVRCGKSRTPSWTPLDEGSAAEFDNIDLFEGAGRPSSRATTTVTGRTSFGEEPGFFQESQKGDARRHAELCEGLAGRHGSVRAVVEDVPRRGRGVDFPFTMAGATSYVDLFSNPHRTNSARSTASQGKWS